MKVSIITVTYNSAATISRAIRSVCRQTYSDIEYIIVDGESADSTMNIVREFAAQYTNIRYISEGDKGIYDAINKGIQMATGDIIGLVNSDDMLADNTIIAQVVEQMDKTGADVLYGDLLYCRYDKLEHNPPRIIRHWKSNDFNSKDMRFGWMAPHPTLYCRRQVFDTVGLYRSDFRISADYEFILRVFSHPGILTTYLPQIMVMMETGGISNRSVRSVMYKMKEDYRALRINGRPPLFTLICKNIRKCYQFFRS